MNPAANKLRELLLSADWQPATEIHERMEAAGYTIDETRTARRKLGVSMEAGGCMRRDGRWWLRLPPDGCPLCQRPWEQGWGRLDYWAGPRPSSPAMTEDDPGTHLDAEPPSSALLPSQPAPLRDYGPPRCSICRKASAVEPGSPCPYWTGAQRCPGWVE